MTNKSTYNVGVAIGRWQVPRLHAGHKMFFEMVGERSDFLLVLVGESGGALGQIDPLTTAARIAMIHGELSELPCQDIQIQPVYDRADNKVWSAQVDGLIATFVASLEPSKPYHVTLYGSRDCFIPSYKGRFPTEEIVVPADIASITGTSQRESEELLELESDPNADQFRCGMIHAANKRFPTSYQTVDVVVVDDLTNPTRILLGQKKIDGGLWRLPGGFVDPTDQSLESAARREVGEEMNQIEVSDPTYMFSARMNDIRYRKSKDKILTSVFLTQFMWGNPKATDDLQAVAWHDLTPALVDQMHPVHKS